jgi:hypothetical protein
MLELIQKIKTYTEAGIILEYMELFDEAEKLCNKKQNKQRKSNAYVCDIGEFHSGFEYGERVSTKKINKYFDDDIDIYLYKNQQLIIYNLHIVIGETGHLIRCEYENIEDTARNWLDFFKGEEA